MENTDRNFDGIWIPKEVYLSRAVCWTAKIIFMEIHSFTSSGKECFVSNERMAEFMGISTTQVSKHISRLIEIGWLEQVSFDGRKRYLRSLMATDFKAAFNLTSRQTTTEVQGSLELNFKHTNTVTKPITNTPLAPQGEAGAPSVKEKNPEGKQAPKKLQPADDYETFVQMLNAATGKGYRGDSKSKAKFAARVKDGYKLGDFAMAIEAAAADDHHRKHNYKWLTPEYITREDQLQKWLNAATPAKPQPKKPMSEAEKQAQMRSMGITF